MPYNRHNTQHQVTTSSTLNGTHTNNRTEGGVIVHNNTLTSNALIQQQQQQSNMMNQNTTTNTNPHQVTYNLNNCFPKSYTEYYQNQLQQQQQHPPQHHSQPQFQTKSSSNAPSHMINAIESDFSTYAVVERPPNSHAAGGPAASVATTNPFLAVSNFKKFDASGEEDPQAGNYQTTSMKRQGKRKTFVDKLEDKRFYSLKFNNNSNKNKPNSKTSSAAQALHLNHSFSGSGNGYHSSGGGVGVLGSLLSSNNKCKRHHSFAGGGLGDVDPKGPVRGNPQLNFYDPPAYENVNDAIQVHNSNLSDVELASSTATVLLHPLPLGAHNGIVAGGSQGPKKKRRQRQHQPKEDLNLIEPERLSIYRSDSGISNSSYECVTPLPSSNRGTPPPAKTPRTPKTPKTPKNHKSQTLAHSAVTANFNSSHKKPAPRVPNPPLYMNLNGEQPSSMSNLERPASPISTMATSAYESASSSQNDNTCNDPISLSSSTSLYSSSNNKSMGAATINNQQRCNRHQQPTEITTPEEFEQYQLGHHAHSTSSLSVASSVSATGSNVVGVGIAGRTKCKKQQRSAIINHLELTNKRPLATNPFLAAKPAAATTTACHKKLHRRQTISDPYAHIKHIDECRRQSYNTVTISSSNNNNKANNYCTKYTNAFKATTATANNSQSSACGPFESQQQQQQQQIVIQPNGNKTDIDNAKQQQPSLSSSSCQQFTTHHQQQMLMFYEQQNRNVDNNCKNVTNVNGRPLNEVHVVPSVDEDDDDNQSLNMPHMSLRCDVAANDDDANDDEKANVNNVVLIQQQQHHHHHQQQQLSVVDDRRLPMTITNRPTILPLENAATTLGYVVRPVKLPLRKYHSFHFQPTQTVAGQHLCQLQQLKLKHQQQQYQQQQQHQPSDLNLDLQTQNYIDSKDLGNAYEQPYAKQGPLVFRPYTVNENVTFKPIHASEESEDSLDLVGEYVGTVKKFLQEEEHYMDSGDFSNLTQRLQQQQDFLKSSNSSHLRNSPKVCRALFEKEQDSSNNREGKLKRNFDKETDQQVFVNSPNSPQVSTPKITEYKDKQSQRNEDLNENLSNTKNFVKSPNYQKVSTLNRAGNFNLKKDLNKTQENLAYQQKDLIFTTLHSSPKDQKLYETHSASKNNAKNSVKFSTPAKFEKSPNSPIVSHLDKSIISRDKTDSLKSPNSPIVSHVGKSLVGKDKTDSLKSPNSPKVLSGVFKENPSHIVVFNEDLERIPENLNNFTSSLKSPNSTLKAITHKTTTNKSLQSGLIINPENIINSTNKPNLSKVSTKSHTPINKDDLGSGSVLSEKDLEKVFRPYTKEPSVKLSDIIKSPLDCQKPVKPFLKSRESKGNLEKSHLGQPLQFHYQSPKKSQVAAKDSFKNVEEISKVSTALNPAASLEALEQLTKSNPELWYTTQPGSRQNLHQLELFHTIQNQTKPKEAIKKLPGNLDDDEEDLGYSFCEDEFDNEDEDDKYQMLAPKQSANVPVILAPNTATENRVKYVLTQNHGEVHI